jgi:hypothetical protein
MQPIENDTKKDAARLAHPDSSTKSTAGKNEHDRINCIADNMAGRGLERQRKDEEGKDIFSK